MAQRDWGLDDNAESEEREIGGGKEKGGAGGKEDEGRRGMSIYFSLSETGAEEKVDDEVDSQSKPVALGHRKRRKKRMMDRTSNSTH